ncbi:MAG TPA: ATP-binding cassette domain-containing protein [Candidatus Baltobacteraceae bacterium]|nr:ATP-binding cassette domain-containing protein [Candidatus Baltobacteraceae bacterium]
MLVVDRVRRSFGSICAVRELSFRVPPGTVFGLLGPNGAGKTTMMRMILGIFAPDAGSVTWQGHAIEPAVRRRFGYLPEERGLYAKMHVREQIEYFGRLHGLDRATARSRAGRWLGTLGLEEYAQRPCGELSKGNQQKVQLACAVLHEPELLILDEPFSGLDPVNAENILACLRELAEGGTTLVLSSHQMWQIENLCREFCIIGAGDVRASGTLEELRRAFPTRVVRVAPDLPAIRATFRRYGAPEPSVEEDALSYVLPADTDFGALLREAVAAGPLTDFERHDPSLNAIYVRAQSEAGVPRA